MLSNNLQMKDIEILKEAKEALINRDAVKCYDSGDKICNCILCKIDRYIENKIKSKTILNNKL
jgi:hypothetical protein